jgi:signal transduction histidine kinase
MFRRVLINLINNAAQATLGVKGERRIRIVAQPPSGKWFVLHVDDNGSGIPEALRSTIFDPYVTHTAGGTGLGLAIVKKIVVEHGGTIEVSSSPMGGARISITLPRDSSDEEGQRRPPSQRGAGHAAADPVPSQPP